MNQTRACPECGTPNRQTAKRCKHCGAALSERAAPSGHPEPVTLSAASLKNRTRRLPALGFSELPRGAVIHQRFEVLELLETRHPRSLKVCTLLDKPDRREVTVPIHYRGFTIPNQFVFGYGLDIDEFYRNLPFIAAVDLERYNPGG